MVAPAATDDGCVEKSSADAAAGATLKGSASLGCRPYASSSCTTTLAITSPATAPEGCCAKTSWVAGAAEMWKTSLLALCSAPLFAVSWNAPAVSTTSEPNVARPAAEVAVSPVRTAPGMSREIEIGAGLRFPKASRTATDTAIAEPATASAGCWTMASRAAPAALTVNGADGSLVADPEAAVSVNVPAVWTAKLSNVAIPCAAAALAPVSTAPAAVSVTACVPGTTLPKESTSATATGIAPPATALAGCCWKTSFASAPGATVNGSLCAVREPAAAVSWKVPAVRI